MPDPFRLTHQLTETLQQLIQASPAPGAAVALWQNGSPLYQSAAGYADPQRTLPLDSQACFYIYSITKTLLAITILRLAEQNLLTLDQPVQATLPDLALKTPVSLRQLLNHSGGIPDYGGMPAYFSALKADPTHAWTSHQFLANVLPQGLTFAPGQGWAYSNIGYLLLRLVIETTLHTSLADALQRTIFAPLGLQQTRTAETLEDAQNLTPGCSAYFSPDGTLQDIHTTYHPGWVSHGVVISTAPELAQIYTALFHGSLLTPASLTAMQTALDVPARHPQFQQPGYGLGLMIDQASPHGFVAGHGGGGPGYSTGALHFSNLHGHRLTSIALVNTDRGDLGLELASKLAHRAAELLNEG